MRIARTIGDALRMVSGNAGELDLVVIDFDHGPDGAEIGLFAQLFRDTTKVL